MFSDGLDCKRCSGSSIASLFSEHALRCFHYPCFALEAPRLARSVSLSAEKVDYASMDVDTLEKEIEGARRKLLDLRLEKRQQSKRSNFKSSEVRELKAKVARIMPFYEAKASAGGPLDAKRAQAKERQANKKETVEA